MSVRNNALTKISFDLIGNELSDNTLLFIHGAGGTKEALRALASQFTDYKCILVDLPGHNLSGEHVPDNVEEYTDIIQKFIQSEKAVLGENITCIGHSMGGFISLELAIRKVPEVKRLVILNSGAALKIDDKFMQKVKEGKIDKSYLFKCSGSFLNLRTYRFFITGFTQMIASQKIMAKDFIAASTFNRKDKVKTINLPTLIVTGEKEILAIPEASKYLNSQIKGSELIIMKGVAHLMPIIIPEKLSVRIKEFFEKNKIVTKAVINL